MTINFIVKFACGHDCAPACSICSQELADSHEPAIKSLEDEIQRLRIELEALQTRPVEQDTQLKRKLVNVLRSVKAALGDRLLAKGPLSKPYAHGIMDEIDEGLALLEESQHDNQQTQLKRPEDK